MAFTRDFDTASPVDHSKINTGPQAARNIKVDLQDRLADIVSGFNSGETVKGVKNLPMITGAAPASAVDQVQVYAKDVGGKAEIHLKDEDANEIQLTSAGKVKAENLSGVYPASSVSVLATMLNLIYPVGSVYCNASNATNPGTLFGIGTWVAIDGYALVGYKSGDPNFGSLGAVAAGEVSHTLTAAESGVPAHTHSGTTYGTSGATKTVVGMGLSGDPNTGSYTTGSNATASASQAHNNIQPSYVVYAWRRSA